MKYFYIIWGTVWLIAIMFGFLLNTSMKKQVNIALVEKARIEQDGELKQRCLELDTLSSQYSWKDDFCHKLINSN